MDTDIFVIGHAHIQFELRLAMPSQNHNLASYLEPMSVLNNFCFPQLKLHETELRCLGAGAAPCLILDNLDYSAPGTPNSVSLASLGHGWHERKLQPPSALHISSRQLAHMMPFAT